MFSPGGVQVLKCYSFQVKDLFLVNFYMKLENIFCITSGTLNSVHPVFWQRYPLSRKCALLRWEDFLLLLNGTESSANVCEAH